MQKEIRFFLDFILFRKHNLDDMGKVTIHIYQSPYINLNDRKYYLIYPIN